MNKVSLEVLEHNVRARRLYDRLGFNIGRCQTAETSFVTGGIWTAR